MAGGRRGANGPGQRLANPLSNAGVRQDRQARWDAYAAVFAALAHPARRRILVTLHFADGEMTAGEIADVFDHAWPTTTRHLQVLQAAGLVRHERQGRTRVYRLDRRRLQLVRDWLSWFTRDPHEPRSPT